MRREGVPVVARSQTVEDGGPRQPIDWTLHHAGQAEEFARIEMAVRRPNALMNFTKRLVIRASQVTGEITASLEGLRTE